MNGNLNIELAHQHQQDLLDLRRPEPAGVRPRRDGVRRSPPDGAAAGRRDVPRYDSVGGAEGAVAPSPAAKGQLAGRRTIGCGAPLHELARRSSGREGEPRWLNERRGVAWCTDQSRRPEGPARRPRRHLDRRPGRPRRNGPRRRRCRRRQDHPDRHVRRPACRRRSGDPWPVRAARWRRTRVGTGDRGAARPPGADEPRRRRRVGRPRGPRHRLPAPRVQRPPHVGRRSPAHARSGDRRLRTRGRRPAHHRRRRGHPLGRRLDARLDRIRHPGGHGCTADARRVVPNRRAPPPASAPPVPRRARPPAAERSCRRAAARSCRRRRAPRLAAAVAAGHRVRRRDLQPERRHPVLRRGARLHRLLRSAVGSPQCADHPVRRPQRRPPRTPSGWLPSPATKPTTG